MEPTRRRFLAATTGLGAATLCWPGLAWGQPTGARAPAPARVDPGADTVAALASRPLRLHLPLAQRAVARARERGASHADARVVHWTRERLGVRDDHIDGVETSEELGLGVRVLVDGGWGFAATPTLSEPAVLAATERAVATAKINAALLRELGGAPVQLASLEPARGGYVAPHRKDPFAVPLADKAGLLIDAASALLRVPGVAHARASVALVREEKLLVTSDEVELHQLYYRVMPQLTAIAVDRRRGGFASTDHDGAPMLAGWEYVESLDLRAAADAVGEAAVRKLHAVSVAPGRRHVILAPSNLWLTIHESIGHPTELDRAQGLEANYAGTSFLAPGDAGSRRIGAPGVHLVADRTQPGGLATTGWDDEGVPSQRWDVVRDGVFVGWQTTRDQAASIGAAASRGCSYADSFSSIAFQRMPNVSLQPGPEGYTTEDLINATEDGVLIAGRGSWSIDHQRYNFQFSGQTFWEIKRGRLTRPLKDVAYQANTVEFWSSCDMIGGEGTYRLGGSFGDGKGEPSQSNSVSHGCPPARFMVDIVHTGAAK
jgi:TldD protein